MKWLALIYFIYKGSKMRKTITYAVILILVFCSGVVVSRYWLSDFMQASIDSDAKKPKVSYWVAPMNPNYRREKPGKSPMGMDLVPVYIDGKLDSLGIVKISPVVENNLGVKTAGVKRQDLSRVIEAVGYVTVDENNIDHIHTYTDGWIKILKVKTAGELVRKGELLLKLYSPTLNNAQEELLLAIENNNQALIRAGEKKLTTLGMSQHQIKELKKSKRVMEHVNINATRSGIVSRLNVREGKFVKPATVLMTIEDLSFIWVIAEVFERQAGWVKEGQDVIATLPYIPSKMWQGKIDYVYPELDPKTHTLQVRIAFPNPDLTMKPNMYANINIYSQPFKNTLTIPHSALIRSGESDRVIIALGDGRYKAQVVKLGIESGDYYQILSGLKEGDKVVTSAQFLIDSESNLKAAISRINGEEEHEQNVPQEFVGMGVVDKVDKAKRKVIIKHQPIPSLNMPAMEMLLRVDKKVNLEEIESGDEVHFVLIRQADKQYLLVKIHATSRGPVTHSRDNDHDK